jgi:hypothetical protein
MSGQTRLFRNKIKEETDGVNREKRKAKIFQNFFPLN